MSGDAQPAATVDVTASLCRKADRWWVVLRLPDGQEVISKQDFPDRASAQAALESWCEASGCTFQRVQ